MSVTQGLVLIEIADLLIDTNATSLLDGIRARLVLLLFLLLPRAAHNHRPTAARALTAMAAVARPAQSL